LRYKGLIALPQIGTQLFWILLTVAGEVITTSTVVWYMIQHQVRFLEIQVLEDIYRVSFQLRQKRIQADIILVSVIGADDQLAHANFYRNTILRIGEISVVEQELAVNNGFSRISDHLCVDKSH
jgi:hypothetical protein